MSIAICYGLLLGLDDTFFGNFWVKNKAVLIAPSDIKAPVGGKHTDKICFHYHAH